MTTIRSRNEILFDYVNILLLICIGLICILPFVTLIAQSFSKEADVLSGRVSLWPIGFNLEAYKVVIGNMSFWRSFYVTIFMTVVGTLLNTLLTVFCGYALSRKNLTGRGLFMKLFVITIVFNGGIIPTYLIVKDTGLLNSVWAVIIPGLVPAFNMIIVRLYFLGLPESLEESAKIDGANHFRILFSIMMPIAMPVIAVILLFNAVGYWNSYFEPLMYINSSNLFPLQLYLSQVINNVSNVNVQNLSLSNLVSQQSVQGAAVVASTIPILIVYPFLQKYFVKGVMLGALKE